MKRRKKGTPFERPATFIFEILLRLSEPHRLELRLQALRLDTGNKEMLIGIIPNSRSFNPQTPFTKENLANRVEAWLTQAGFGSQQNFVDLHEKL